MVDVGEGEGVDDGDADVVSNVVGDVVGVGVDVGEGDRVLYLTPFLYCSRDLELVAIALFT